MTFSFLYALLFGLICEVDKTEGVRWINTPSDITICSHETANLTWEYLKEQNEDIRQFQWRLNSSTLIAYRSVDNGLHIDRKYLGRVEESGVTGILLKNITAIDIGTYSLYIIIAWKETPIFQSISLNVIDADAPTIPLWCTCERFTISQEWSGGRSFNLVTDGCRLEVNSSHCCKKEPANRCKDNNPQDLCLRIWRPINRIKNDSTVRDTNNITDNYTQNGLVTEGLNETHFSLISVVNRAIEVAVTVNVTISMLVCDVIAINWLSKTIQLVRKKYQRAKMKPVDVLEQGDGKRTPRIRAFKNLKYTNALKSKKSLEEGATSCHVSRASTCSQTEEYSDYSSLRISGLANSDISVDSKTIRYTFRTDDEL